MVRSWVPCKIYRKPEGGEVLFTQHWETRKLRKEPLAVLRKFDALSKADLPVYQENPKYLEYFDRQSGRQVSRWAQVGDVVHFQTLQFGECIAEAGGAPADPLVKVKRRDGGVETLPARDLTVVHHAIAGMGRVDHEGHLADCKLPLKTVEELEFAERICQQKTLDWLLQQPKTVSIDVSFVREVHRRLMGPLFEWAGEYRTVQSFVGRGDYQTTPPRFIDAEMREFDDLLGEVSSKLASRGESDRSFWLLLARIYFELCRIHPFRDGNGRVSRLVMTAFIGREAQRPAPLDWESLKRASNQTDRAFEAARDDSDLKPLASLIRKAFRKGRGN